MRLINADNVEKGFEELCRSPYFKEDASARLGAETLMDLCVRSDSHKPNTVDPESMPIVKELRGQAQSLEERLERLKYWDLERQRLIKSSNEDRAAVNVMRKHCEKTIAELRAELRQAKIELESMRTASNSLKMHLENVKAERDAAIDDLRGCAIESYTECMYCRYNTARSFCWDCTDGSNWAYRGPWKEIDCG